MKDIHAETMKRIRFARYFITNNNEDKTFEIQFVFLTMSVTSYSYKIIVSHHFLFRVTLYFSLFIVEGASQWHISTKKSPSGTLPFGKFFTSTFKCAFTFNQAINCCHTLLTTINRCINRCVRYNDSSGNRNNTGSTHWNCISGGLANLPKEVGSINSRQICLDLSHLLES